MGEARLMNFDCLKLKILLCAILVAQESFTVSIKKIYFSFKTPLYCQSDKKIAYIYK